MSKKILNYGGYITICDTTTNMGMSSCPSNCFPYSFQSCLSDSVELNREKQEYNRHSYKFISSPKGAFWKQFVAERVEKIKKLSNNTANITGYISYTFRVNCRHGCMVRDENTIQDNECIECLRARSSAERSWERYDGEF